VQALEKKGITALFPIQKSVFDPAMAGNDLVGRARTGSGKTLAFSLPILEGILKQNNEEGLGRGPRNPRAVILTPTRELCKQVANELKSATHSSTGLEVCTVYGGTPLGPQVGQIERGIDILVGTPGRVIDLVQKRRSVACISVLRWS
jgi:ATP-dependent RNA helicase DDX21